MKGRSVESKEPGPAGLPLAEYYDHREQVRDDQVLWENNGWSLRGLAGDQEFLLWVSPYLLKGFPGGAFRLDRASVNQTMLIFADDTSQPLDQPNQFWSAGWEPHEFGAWSDWTVSAEGDTIRWSGGDRVFYVDGTGWRVTGSHAGVGVDVRLAPDGDAMWLSPPEETLSEREDRWWIANADVSGTLTLGGTSSSIDAHALHERHIHLGRSYNPVALLRNGGVTWHSGAAPGVRYSVLARPSLGRFWALVDVDGRRTELRDPNQLRVRAEDYWVDPETSLYLPRVWSVRIDASDVRLELRTTAHARAYYLWNYLRDGVTVLYWWLCTSTGSVRLPSGRMRQLRRIRSEVHLNKTIYEAPSHAHQVVAIPGRIVSSHPLPAR